MYNGHQNPCIGPHYFWLALSMGTHIENYLDLLSRKTSCQKKKKKDAGQGPRNKVEKLENCEASQPCDKLTASVEEWMRFRNKMTRGKVDFGWIKENIRKISIRMFSLDQRNFHSFIHWKIFSACFLCASIYIINQRHKKIIALWEPIF